MSDEMLWSERDTCQESQCHTLWHYASGHISHAAAARQTTPTMQVVVDVEVGDRFVPEAVQLLRLLAMRKAGTVTAASRPAAITAWVARWSGLLAVAAQRTYAASLLELPPAEALCNGHASCPAKQVAGKLNKRPHNPAA